MSKPWENLRYVSKVEIVPAPGHKEVNVFLQEDVEYENWHDGSLRNNIVYRERTLRLTNETLNFHSDYPENFKKLVAACEGDYPKAYNLYQALQKPVPHDWDVCNKDGEFDCDCC